MEILVSVFAVIVAASCLVVLMARELKDRREKTTAVVKAADPRDQKTKQTRRL
jgi:hypothetical protein